jgi:hypothetical protein
MPGFLLHRGAQVQCSHLGTASPIVTNPRLKVTGMDTVSFPALYSIAGCTMPPPIAGNGPCVTAQWANPSTRVLSNAQFLLLSDSQATCVPTGTPLLVLGTQTRVRGI